ncbi:hypothetical protein [Dickeya dianthicola]|uniref:hypothetical protein n=1 Tax=Dickeya dianthicola TaxID=204039 RepID=UPI003018FB33
MNQIAGLPQYKCHKIVGALKIKVLHHHPDGAAVIEPVEPGRASFLAPADWIEKHKPEAGSYFVVYEKLFTGNVLSLR